VGTVGTVGTSHEPTSAALAHIRRSLYEHDVISALVHVYLGRFSDDAALSELPEWSAITNKGTYTRVANKDPILRVLVWLVHHHQEEQGEHQGEPMSARAVASLQESALVVMMLNDHALKAIELLAPMIQGNGVTSMSCMKILLRMCTEVSSHSTMDGGGSGSSSSGSSSSGSSGSRRRRRRPPTKFDILIDLIKTMLAIEDQFTPVRLTMLLTLGQRDDGVNGLSELATIYTSQSLKSPRFAERAYTLIKILATLDAMVPSVHVWLKEHRTHWIGLVTWLDETSYEPSLKGNRYTLTRQKSAEETVQRLAVTGEWTCFCMHVGVHVGVHVGTSWYILVHLGVVLVHPGTSWYILIHRDTSWYILVHLGTSWYILVHLDTSWYILVHLGTS
jgi:hypothetical protein